MADQLGEAVLKVKVDATQLEAGLQAAQQKATATGGALEQAFSRGGRPIQTATNGLRYFIDAQGRARDEAGKFLTIAEKQAAGLDKLAASAKRAGDASRGISDRSPADASGSGLGGMLAGLAPAAFAGPQAGAVAVAAAVAGIGVAATQSAGQIQKLGAAFTGLTGSEEAAKQLRQDLFTLSKTTPFKNEEILTAAQRFLAVGVNAKNLQGTINRVGALAAQSGQSLERLALIYAQVYAKGRLQGEENMQFLEAGVDLTQELAQVTGLSGQALQKAMSDGKIGVADVNKALVLATGDMKSLELAGKSVDTQFNNVFDNLGQLFGGFAQALSPALAAVFNVINQVFDTMFPSLESITQFFQPLTEGAQQFATALERSPETVQLIAEGIKSLGTVGVNIVADGFKMMAQYLDSIDTDRLAQGFIVVELIVRRLALAADAFAASVVKTGELQMRVMTNPLQFGKDVFNAGGFSKFLASEFSVIEGKWKRWADSKPLELPQIKSQPQDPAKLAGDLSDKADQIDGALSNGSQSLKDAADYAANKIVSAFGIPLEQMQRYEAPATWNPRQSVGSINGKPLYADQGNRYLSWDDSDRSMNRFLLGSRREAELFNQFTSGQAASATEARDLVSANMTLKEAIVKLTEKDWTVQVNVNGSQVNAITDQLNRAVS